VGGCKTDDGQEAKEKEFGAMHFDVGQSLSASS